MKEKKRNVFWEEPSECFGSFDTWDRIMVLRDLNAKVGVVATEGIIIRHGFLV